MGPISGGTEARRCELFHYIEMNFIYTCIKMHNNVGRTNRFIVCQTHIGSHFLISSMNNAINMDDIRSEEAAGKK